MKKSGKRSSCSPSSSTYQNDDDLYGACSHNMHNANNTMRAEETEFHTVKKKRKSISSIVICPACGVSVRSAELESHYLSEVKRLDHLNTRRSADQRMKKLHYEKKRLRHGEEGSKDGHRKGEVLMDSTASEERLKKFHDIQKRRRTRQVKVILARKFGSTSSSIFEDSSTSQDTSTCFCPICGVDVSGDPVSSTSHVETCIAKEEGADFSNESDDDESDRFEEYSWAGQTRVRATSLLQSGLSSLEGKTLKLSMTDEDEELNIDEEDDHIYGVSQYSEKDVIPCPSDEPSENMSREKIRAAIIGDKPCSSVSKASRWAENGELQNNGELAEPANCIASDSESRNEDPCHIINSIKTNVSKLEVICSDQPRCLICMEQYQDPLVSVVCWHVHCEECWMRTLGAKKLCPQCNVITSPNDLRKIFL